MIIFNMILNICQAWIVINTTVFGALNLFQYLLVDIIYAAELYLLKSIQIHKRLNIDSVIDHAYKTAEEFTLYFLKTIFSNYLVVEDYNEAILITDLKSIIYFERKLIFVRCVFLVIIYNRKDSK